ncbi:uncharacterized protein LOC110664143 [Hevea brasiliensis]|uniref:uncharacterized protein LOC110664143 n=1 Tax=Hevea brasiliensis TaxID=3981 RepID=UPI0025D19158|nr:uncharacterized protein LOC110664143 [Hevea brasiliensis]
MSDTVLFVNRTRLEHPSTAKSVVQAFLDNVFMLYGLLQTIISDRDDGVSLHMYVADHPQKDGQTKYNTSYNSTIHKTPFEALYGVLPPIHIPYMPKDSNATMDIFMRDRESAISLLKHHLTRHSVAANSHHKLRKRYYGPYQVIDKVAPVAHKLQVPSKARIHNVFHVSFLKLAHIAVVASSYLPQLPQQPFPYLQAILERKMVKRRNQAAI